MFATLPIFADTPDTAVFQTRMLPDNEVPPIAAPGNSAAATITVHVTRDARGNVNAATVMFEIDYTVTSSLTFTGLHIHNAPVAQNGSVVIDTGISAANPVSVTAGSGRISRTVDYSSTDTNGIKFVTGLMAVPENYYVNIHTTTNPGGFMRGQLRANRLVLRPVMSSVFEVPAVNLDAEGAAFVDIQVIRDPATGAITSGTVVFDVDYRFPGPVTLTGLHIHNGAFGVNGPIVIDSGLNGTTRAVANVTRGNIFRIAEINSTDTAGLAALTGLMSDPTLFYINMHTTVNPGGVIRGQFSKNTYVFFNQMTQAEEVPPTGSAGTANSMTYARLDRDSTGNVVSGAVSFNLNINMGAGPVTFTGLHIHNGKFATNAAVVLNSGITSLTLASGGGSINREIGVDGSNAVALDSLRGLIENPELYYINIHTTQFPGGVIRSQMARETYHFKANMSTANEVPPITGVDTAATGWITAKISRDANGVLNGGTVTFDVNFTNTGAITFTGLHIHHPGAAGINAAVVINTGLSAAAPFDSPTGSGNITRVVDVPSTSTTGIAALNTLISSPDNAYVNLHTTQFSGGVVRSQMFPVMNAVPQAAGGAEWISSITIRNPSTTASVQGILNLFLSSGSPMPEAISDPNQSFLIPPSGSVTFNTHNKGPMTVGFARIFSNGNVTVTARYFYPTFTSAMTAATTVTSRSVSIPVSVGTTSAASNTGIALLANTAGTLTLVLTDSSGGAIAGGSRSINVTAGQQIVGFVKDLLPGVTATSFTGTLTISIGSGTISGLAMQFDGNLAPVTITALP
jgi:hypothetical protein